MSSPTWYDLLGVEPDATPDQIKAAWRDATDKFEPGSGAGQFRLFNEAADVLLDPARRAEYDAELAGAAAPAATVVTEKVTNKITDKAPEPTTEQADDEPEEADRLEAADDRPASPSGPGRVSRVLALLTTTRSLAAVGALTVLSLVLLVVVYLTGDLGEKVDEYQAGPEAKAVADRALTAALSYNYQSLDQDLNTATSYMTKKQAAAYEKVYEFVCDPNLDSPATAKARKIVAVADVIDTGIVDASTDRVRLLVFVNQTVASNGGEPAVRQNQVLATLVKDGDRWLLDGLENRNGERPSCVTPSDGATQNPTPGPSASPSATP